MSDNKQSVRTWVYYEVSSNDTVHFQSLSKIEAEFYARNILQRTRKMPEIYEHTRSETDSPK